MSAALLGLALKAKLYSQTRKLVLIQLVDCCHEDGTRIYPSLATIADAAECSVPTARRVMKTFCRIGLLRKVREGGSGAGSTAHYEMDIALLARLRRPELWPALEAASLHEPATDSDEDDEAVHASGAGQNGPSDAENKGVRMEGYHGDTLPNGEEGYHPDDTQPLSKTLRPEREGAHGREAAPADPVQPEQVAATPTFEDLLEGYPHAKVDNRSKLRSAWEALAFDQRRLAIDAIPAFLADRKAAGYKGRMPATEYLAGRNWIGLEALAAQRAATTQAGAPVAVQAWSRDWWLLLLERIATGRPPSFWVAQAEAGKALGSTAAEIAAASARIGALSPFRCDGPEIEAWRVWLAAKGARIPPFKGDFRVFLPGPLPPGGRRDDGDDDVRL